ncbi:helix-turn-helix domain-containing protein [Arthrobacter woluwensis]|uniref:helix-turn-helix domain-containing protein n=1 Tax=Arthrobacter woluwensis TaxID=156980 RepID=UPI00380AD261
MAGAIRNDVAEQLRAVITGIIEGNGPASAYPARDVLLGAVDVLEQNDGAVVLPVNALMSTQEAAELLGVSRMTVVRLIDRGELAAEGGRVHRKISATELARYRTATVARRRTALRELAQDISEDPPTE